MILAKGDTILTVAGRGVIIWVGPKTGRVGIKLGNTVHTFRPESVCRIR